MATIIPADSQLPERQVAPQNGTDFQLQELYQLLHCSAIEILDAGNGQFLVIDDAGKLKRLPRNERATRLTNFASPEQIREAMERLRKRGIPVIWLGQPSEPDYIAGDAVLCSANEVQ